MKILEIKLTKKCNANIFTAVADVGDYLLHSDIIVKYGIRVGDIDDEIFYNAVRESGVLIGYNHALKYIGANLKTEKQIKDYLYRKDYTREVVDEVINKLKEYKIIDDKSYVDMYVRSNPSFSKTKMKQKLYSFGVKNDLVDEGIEEIDDYTSAIKNAEKFMKNKENTKENIDKLIRRMNYLGYGWDTIKKVLNQLRCDMEEL